MPRQVFVHLCSFLQVRWVPVIWGVVLATQIQKDGRAGHRFMEIKEEDRITKERQELVSAEEELVSKHN